METIQAMVNPRLLTKANRLFTGSLQGRVIEILQNARRAGATKVMIVNKDGHVTVRDNGKGIEDFAKLLDLGNSGWENALDASEDPAGVGIFCLAPREVTIRSNSKIVTISGCGWTGAPVEVRDDLKSMPGTVLRFQDKAWTMSEVELHAVFCGMQVTVDGKDSTRLTFVSDQATTFPEFGCRIEVRESQDLNPWHHSSKRENWQYANVLVNFHGQVVGFSYQPVSEHYLNILVHMTGEPTGVRLMLPARTQLVENEAFETLKQAIELEAYRYIQTRGSHSLPYKEYLRAKELGIDLPEAKPTFTTGLLAGAEPEPVAVEMPKDFPLTKCYRLDPEFENRKDTDEANAHLLAAVGKFDEPFVPVDIRKDYDGYSWADLPTIRTVGVTSGKVLQESALWCGNLVCVDKLDIHVDTSDGRTWSAPVCMAIRPATGDCKNRWWDDEVLVTPEARMRLNSTDILYHLGGFSDEGDTWDTQEVQFQEELEQFWDRLIGPDESLRRRLVEILSSLTGWKEVRLFRSGAMGIHLENGSIQVVEPPSS